MKKQFLVIGLGRFGASVARTLTEENHSVVGIDTSEDRIQRVSEEIADVIKCDATDADLLDTMGVADYEAVIVCIGEKYIQNSILVTLILKEKGARKIIAKAGTINDAAFEGFEQGQVYFAGISGGTAYDSDGEKFWKFDLNFMFRIIQDDTITADDWNYIARDNGAWDRPNDSASGDGNYLYTSKSFSTLI